MPLIILLYPIK